MREYPKIETLYDRDERTHKVIPGKIRLPEFDLVSRWMVTEKIDGTNIRVHLRHGEVMYGGRTDAAQLHASLVDWLRTRLPADKVRAAFGPGVEAILFGEGYGPKIQKGGGLYRADVSFRLFDVLVVTPERDWWLAVPDVADVASKLGIETVPVLGANLSLEAAVSLVRGVSLVARIDAGAGCEREGIVCRTDPMLLTRRGDRVMWKLKGKDF
jgi:ATP-dependent RNA circularization protein (DNA/RNA ligase family)